MHSVGFGSSRWSRALRVAHAVFAVLLAFSSLLSVPQIAQAAGGSYSIKWYAADPEVNRAPYLPTYPKVSPAQQACSTPSGGTGRAANPLANAVAYASPATASNLDAVTSLAPKSMALGQIVPFELEVTVSGATTPENGVIEVTPYWLTKTTSGGNFGFDPAYGIYCAFVDTADPGTSDAGNNAKVASYSSTTVNPGTSNEQIQGPIRISGLDNGDKVIVEIWVVLKNTIPSGVTGNVQTGIVGAKTASNDTINTGNQTVPLLRVQEFFSSNADISLAKSDSPDPVLRGDQLSYTLVVKNNSVDTVANGVVVTDNLDPNTTYVSGTSATAGVSCSASAGVATCTLGSLAPGQTVTILITVTVSSSAPFAGTVQTGECTVGQSGVDLCNRASVTAITGDSTPGNNSDTEPTNGVVVPSLSITKTTTTPTVNAGELINYTITVSNGGAGAASNVQISDQLPGGGGLDWSVASASAGLTCTITGALGSEVLSCSTASLAAGATVSVTVTSQTTAASCASYLNTANVQAGNNGQISTSPVSVAVKCPALAITKIADAATVNAGEQIGFTIEVKNTGAGTATGVQLSDTLPANAGLSWSISPAVSGCSISSGVLSCTVGALAAGASFSVHVVSPTTSASCGNVPNMASVSAGNASGAQASAAIAVNCPSLQISKTADAASVNAGEGIGFVITVKNNGPGTAKNVAVNDTPPTNAGLNWQIDAGGSDAGCTISGGQLTCAFGDLASGASRRVHITSPTTAASCGVVSNSATATADNGAGAGPAAATITVACPDVTVEKTADNGTIDAGDTAAFTIVVSNNGPGTAKNVSVNDPLPAGVAWALSPAVPGCAISSNTLTCSFATLAAGAGSAITIHILGATDAADCGQLENTVSVGASNEPTSAQGNNGAKATISVNCAAISIEKKADAATVSAGEQIGFLITVSNTGAGTAKNVTLNDTLPATPGLGWQIDAGGSDAGCAISGGQLTCAFGSLGPNATKKVHITSATGASSCGVVSNLASVTTTNDGAAQASDSVTVLCPNVTVLKTADADPISAGDTASFTIVVRNIGAGTATGAQLSDPLPAGIAWSEDSPDCSISGGALSCNFGSLAPNATRTIHVSGLTDAADCKLLPNTATVSATNEPASADGDNASAASITVQCPDVTVLKTAVEGSISAGDTASFSIVVSNNGAGIARDVKLSDTLPAGIDWSTASAGCSISGGVLSCDFGDLGPNDARTVTVSGKTDAADCGKLENSASVSAANEAPAQGDNNESTASIGVNCADIELTKTADAATVSAGDAIGFTITATNAGAGTARGVSLTDVLPTNVGLAWQIDGGTGAGQCAINSGTLTCSFGDLAPGASLSVHIASPTAPATCGIVDNTAEVTTTNDGAATASDQVAVLCPNVTVEKSADASPISAGDTASFSIIVSNNGDGIARDVKLSDPLPAGIDWSENSADCAIANGVLSCDFGDLAPNATRSVTVSGKTDAADCGPLLNTASVSAANEPSSASGDNSDSAEIAVHCPDVLVTKTADEGTISAGDTARFTITVQNVGAGTARDVKLSDTLPAGIAWSEDSASCSIASGVLSCSFGDLAPGASRVVHLSGDTSKDNCGELPNTATVSAANEAADATANNTSRDAIAVNCPHIEIAKTADAATVSAGDAIGFTIEVKNTGTGTARSVSLTDELPTNAGLSWTISPPVNGCAISSGTLTCAFGDMAGNTAKSVHISSPTTAATCGIVDNTADVTSANDGAAASSAQVTVDCPNVTVLKTADNSPISAGDTAKFTIVVSNVGNGIARSVTLSDPLPASITWSEDSADCAISGGALSCDFGDLPAGAKRTIHVSGATDAADCGPLPNTASVSAANEAASTLNDNTSSATITVQCPNVTVEKTAASGTISAGDTTKFTVVVRNVGQGTARSVKLSDPLPAGITWSEDSADCSISGGALSCDFGDLAPGASVSVHVSGKTAAANCGELPNTATVSAANEAASADGDNTSSATITVQCPNVVVAKVADKSPVSAGDPIGFTISVANNGAGTAYDVKVSDTLPTNAGLSWSINPAVSGCAISSGKLTCTFGTLASGDEVSVHITSPTTAATCGAVNNTASVTLSNGSAAPASDSVTVACPELVIDKTADAASVNAGDPIGFSITVTNNGPGTAKAVTLHDALPSGAGIAWVLAPPVSGCAITNGVLDCTFGDLAGTESRSVHVVSATSFASCATYNNTAVASAANNPDVQDSASTAVNCPELVVDKTADKAAVNAGEAIGFSVTVKNTGTGAATGVMLFDTLPTNSALNWQIDGGTGASDCAISGGTLSCAFGTLGAGASKGVHISSPTSYSSCATIANVASASANNAPPASDGAEVVVNCPSLAVDKQADKEAIDAGDAIGFTITVTNNGPGAATGVTISDLLPVGGGIDWSISPANAKCQIAAGTLSCDVGVLAAKASFSVHITSATTAASCGSYTNLATVSSTNHPSVDDSASVAVNCAAIQITKVADAATVNAGQPIGFSITLTNNGPGAAKGVSLSDALPAGAGIVWALSPAVAGCSISAGTLTCTFGDLPAGATRTVHLTSPTTAATCGATYTNTATAKSANHPSVTSLPATVAVLCANVKVVKTADAAAVDDGTKVGFLITVTSTGPGTATGVTLSDTLPTNAGLAWAIDGGTGAAKCGIANGKLACTFGDMPSGTSYSVHIASPTTVATCGVVSNTATVAATNEGDTDKGDNSSSAATTVRCAKLAITKTASPATVNAGGAIGFVITLSNGGSGAARNVALSDALPGGAGISWSIASGSVTGGASCLITGAAPTQTLTCTLASLAAGGSFSVKVTSATSYACSVYQNTATAQASNHGSVSASATASTNCLHPGTIGFWRNWRNHYSTTQFQLLLNRVKQDDAAVYNKDATLNTADDLTIAKLDAIFNYGTATPRAQQILGQLTAAALNLAVTQIKGTSGIVQKNDNLCRAGLVSVGGIAGAAAFFGSATPTVGQVLAKVESRWTVNLTTSPNDWKFNLTTAEQDLVIKVLTGINEGTILLTSGC